MDAKTVMAMRQFGQDFEDWRRLVSKLSRSGGSDTESELRERVGEEVMPQIHRLKRVIQKSSALPALREQSATTVITTDVTVGASILSSESPLLAHRCRSGERHPQLAMEGVPRSFVWRFRRHSRQLDDSAQQRKEIELTGFYESVALAAQTNKVARLEPGVTFEWWLEIAVR